MSPSSNNQQQASVEHNDQSVSVQFNPKQSVFTGLANGRLAIGCLTIIALSLLVALQFGNTFFAKCFFGAALMLVAVFIGFDFFIKNPKVTVNNATVNFDGVSEKSVASLFSQWVNRSSLPHFPEPDAKVDLASGKVLPFQPGEKEIVLEEQMRIEEIVKNEIVALGDAPPSVKVEINRAVPGREG